MEKEQIREVIARRVAQELNNGDVVNLGIGFPSRVPDYLPEGVEVILQTENGLIGMGPTPAAGEEDPDLINAGGGEFVRSGPGKSYDSIASLTNGSDVKIVSSAGDGWYQITFSGNGGKTTTGYMKGDYLANS